MSAGRQQVQRKDWRQQQAERQQAAMKRMVDHQKAEGQALQAKLADVAQRVAAQKPR